MKSIRCLLSISLFILGIIGFSEGQPRLSELYKTSKIRLEKEFVLDDGSMPDDTFFESPSSAVIDQDGNLYVIDSGASNIKKFDRQGKFLQTIGHPGQGPGEFDRPYYSTFAKDRLVVWDSGHRRLYAFTPDGKLLESGSIDYDEGSVRKLGSLPSGEIVIEKEKTFRSEPDKPQLCTIDIYSPELEYLRTIYKKSLWRKKYIRTREFGISTLYFPYSPDVHWVTSPKGYIIIGFSGDYVLEVYDGEGKKMSSFSHDYDPAKVTDKNKKDYFDSLEFYVMGERLKEPPEYIRKDTEFPKAKPPFRNVLTDPEGNILVILNRELDDEQGRVLDVFSSRGDFISSVRVEGEAAFPDTRNINLDKGSLYVLQTGEDDLYRVIKYRIEPSSIPNEAKRRPPRIKKGSFGST